MSTSTKKENRKIESIEEIEHRLLGMMLKYYLLVGSANLVAYLILGSIFSFHDSNILLFFMILTAILVFGGYRILRPTLDEQEKQVLDMIEKRFF